MIFRMHMIDADGSVMCHQVEVVAVGLKSWVGACRHCGMIFRITTKKAHRLTYDGEAILLGGAKVWPPEVKPLRIAA